MRPLTVICDCCFKGGVRLFRPNIWVKNVFAIDGEFLRTYDIKGLILDLDNTLSMHGNPAVEKGVNEWLEKMKSLGIKMIVVSNNTSKRVTPLVTKLGLPFIAFGCKPLPFGIMKAARLLELSRKNIVVVGDQIFTDVMGGNLCGIRTVLVEPFHLENNFAFKIKRKVESVFFKRDYSKLEIK